MLNELDKELEQRGHRFVQYANDCMIFCLDMIHDLLLTGITG